jgi:hypothetical protein
MKRRRIPFIENGFVIRAEDRRWRKLLSDGLSQAKIEASVRRNAALSSVVWSIAGLLDGLSFHLKICGGITVGCRDTGVPKPLADCEDVDPCAQQMYRSPTAHAVGV